MPQVHIPLVSVSPIDRSKANEHVGDGEGEIVIEGVTEGVMDGDGITDGDGVLLGLTDGVTDGEGAALIDIEGVSLAVPEDTTTTGGTGMNGGETLITRGGIGGRLGRVGPWNMGPEHWNPSVLSSPLIQRRISQLSPARHMDRTVQSLLALARLR